VSLTSHSQTRGVCYKDRSHWSALIADTAVAIINVIVAAGRAGMQAASVALRIAPMALLCHAFVAALLCVNVRRLTRGTDVHMCGIAANVAQGARCVGLVAAAQPARGTVIASRPIGECGADANASSGRYAGLLQGAGVVRRAVRRLVRRTQRAALWRTSTALYTGLAWRTPRGRVGIAQRAALRRTGSASPWLGRAHHPLSATVWIVLVGVAARLGTRAAIQRTELMRTIAACASCWAQCRLSDAALPRTRLCATLLLVRVKARGRVHRVSLRATRESFG